MPPTSTPSAGDARIHLQTPNNDGKTFRLLDALLTHSPTVEGLGVIAAHIVAGSAEPDGLNQLAEFYTTRLLLPSKLYVISRCCIRF